MGSIRICNNNDTKLLYCYCNYSNYFYVYTHNKKKLTLNRNRIFLVTKIRMHFTNPCKPNFANWPMCSLHRN